GELRSARDMGAPSESARGAQRMTGEELPKARLRRRRLFNLAWLVPLVAAAVAGWLIWQRYEERGPDGTVSFSAGARPRGCVTPGKYGGGVIGEVSGVGLSRDHKHVLVRTRLQRAASNAVAREGAVFWIVRPQVGFGNVQGLNTVLTGPEIHVLPPRTEDA